jgi:hypothetical protein
MPAADRAWSQARASHAYGAAQRLAVARATKRAEEARAAAGGSPDEVAVGPGRAAQEYETGIFVLLEKDVAPPKELVTKALEGFEAADRPQDLARVLSTVSRARVAPEADRTWAQRELLRLTPRVQAHYTKFAAAQAEAEIAAPRHPGEGQLRAARAYQESMEKLELYGMAVPKELATRAYAQHAAAADDLVGQARALVAKGAGGGADPLVRAAKLATSSELEWAEKTVAIAASLLERSAAFVPPESRGDLAARKEAVLKELDATRASPERLVSDSRERRMVQAIRSLQARGAEGGIEAVRRSSGSSFSASPRGWRVTYDSPSTLRHELQHLLDYAQDKRDLGMGKAMLSHADGSSYADPATRSVILRRELVANYAESRSVAQAVRLTYDRYGPLRGDIDAWRKTGLPDAKIFVKVLRSEELPEARPSSED